ELGIDGYDFGGRNVGGHVGKLPLLVDELRFVSGRHVVLNAARKSCAIIATLARGNILVACNSQIGTAGARLARRCCVARRRHSHHYDSSSRLAPPREPRSGSTDLAVTG